MTPYLAWPRARRSDETISLRAIEPEDIEAVRQWRNAQMDVLRQVSPISEKAQVAYFSQHVWPQKALAEPSQILFAIEREGGLSGYGGIVNLSWPNRRGEISFLLDPTIAAQPAIYRDICQRYFRLVQAVGFEDLRLARLFTETFSHRSAHIGALESVGMILEGRLRDHVLVNGKPTDAVIHAILSREWSPNG